MSHKPAPRSFGGQLRTALTLDTGRVFILLTCKLQSCFHTPLVGNTGGGYRSSFNGHFNHTRCWRTGTKSRSSRCYSGEPDNGYSFLRVVDFGGSGRVYRSAVGADVGHQRVVKTTRTVRLEGNNWNCEPAIRRSCHSVHSRGLTVIPSYSFTAQQYPSQQASSPYTTKYCSGFLPWWQLRLDFVDHRGMALPHQFMIYPSSFLNAYDEICRPTKRRNQDTIYVQLKST